MNICYLDATAVYTFFKLSGKKHLFITGDRGSGKSYLLKNILNCISYTSDTTDISHAPKHSFDYLQSYRTNKPDIVIRSNLIDNNKEFMIGIPTPPTYHFPASTSLPPVKKNNTKGNNMTIVEDGFINCAIPAIHNHLLTSPDDFFIIDELGYLESSCFPFQEAVEALLDNSHVIAIIRKQSTAFLDRIKKRNDAITIDIDNIFSPLACIIMASGISERFGSNKLLAGFNGHTLFENAVNISSFADFGETLTVTRHDEVKNISEREHIHCLKHSMLYRNEAIHLGVAHILEKDHIPQGILFLPADQPLITKTSLQLLCLAFIYYNSNTFSCHDKNGRICRLAFNDVPGSPVIFPACYYDDLLNLPQGKGGGFIAKKHPAQVTLVPAQDEYELYDIDTPDDLNRLSQYPY